MDLIDRDNLLKKVYQVYIKGEGFTDIIYFKDLIREKSIKLEEN